MKVSEREQMNVVIAGHVDHGKSTIIGRLLVDTNSLPEGKLEQVRKSCERSSKPFEYAFLLDALKDEQSQGITIDSARVFFSTRLRDYIIIDAPGHIEFLKNMVTGASRAEAALLVVDAEEGVQENSRRHAYMISMLGIRQIIVLVSKMDLVDYSRKTFNSVVDEYTRFLSEINLAGDFVPVDAVGSENIVSSGKRMPWYKGQTVLQALDSFSKEAPSHNKPFRMPVQDVYKFTKEGDKRRIVAGTIETGQIEIGDEVVFYPSGKHSRIKSIEVFNRSPIKKAAAGAAIAFTLDKQVYISRGEIAAKQGQTPPDVTSNIRVNLFWMGRKPMVKDKSYLIKVGTAKQQAELTKVISVIDASDLSTTQDKSCVGHHDVAECVLSLRRAIAFDRVENIAATSRFVIVDDYEICGGGIIREAIKDEQLWVRDYVMKRNYEWQRSAISREDRAERYNQKATLILVTGRKDVGKKTLAKAIEARLFADGKVVYFLGIGNILYGVDADIKTPGTDGHRQEHVRRLAEVANVMLDAGIILVVTAIGLAQRDLDIIRTSLDTDSINVVWVGDNPTDITSDLTVPCNEDFGETVEKVKVMLQNSGVIFKP